MPNQEGVPEMNIPGEQGPEIDQTEPIPELQEVPHEKKPKKKGPWEYITNVNIDNEGDLPGSKRPGPDEDDINQ